MMVACIISLIVPIGHLLGIESHIWRGIAACLFVFAPMFFANMMFSVTFRDRQEAEKYFGWNLAGGPLGGLIEYTSMLTGYHLMSWLVLFFYLTVFICIYPEFRQRKDIDYPTNSKLAPPGPPSP